MLRCKCDLKSQPLDLPISTLEHVTKTPLNIASKRDAQMKSEHVWM